MKIINHHILLWAVLGLIGFNAVFFVLKNAQALAGREQRNPELANEFIKKHIPSGSKVVGEPMFYYAVLLAGSDYQYYNYYNEQDERERLHREVYDYDYLIVTKYHAERDYKKVIPYYFSKSDLRPIATLESKEPKWSAWISGLGFGSFKLLSNVEKHGYSCTIYKRVK